MASTDENEAYAAFKEKMELLRPHGYELKSGHGDGGEGGLYFFISIPPDAVADPAHETMDDYHACFKALCRASKLVEKHMIKGEPEGAESVSSALRVMFARGGAE